MKKIVLIVTVMFIVASFKPSPKLNWLGTFEMYSDEQGSLIVYYKGTIPQCTGKKVINFVYVDCDTVIHSKESEDLPVKIYAEPIDTCKKKKPITKTTRI